jgi:hypothetical protein
MSGFTLRLALYILPVFACAWACSEVFTHWYIGILITASAAFVLGLLTGLLRMSDFSLLVRGRED